MKSKEDKLFETEDPVTPFSFDKNVVEVFQDMIQRSVPGYELSLQMISILAQDFVQNNSSVYDLGCSLGASIIPIAKSAQGKDFQLFGVDNSAAMINQCEKILSQYLKDQPYQLVCADIQTIDFNPSSLILLNFTLQFIPLSDRLPLLEKIQKALLPNGALLLSEKISFSDATTQYKQTAWHHAFKAEQGYSQLEIAKKRQSLENVLIPENMNDHIERLHQAGFSKVIPWFQCFSFVSLVAIK